MSVIEKALRKSEQERQKHRGQTESFKELLDSLKPQKPPTNFLYVVYLVSMIAVGVAGAWLVKKALFEEEKRAVAQRPPVQRRVVPQRQVAPRKEVQTKKEVRAQQTQKQIQAQKEVRQTQKEVQKQKPKPKEVRALQDKQARTTKKPAKKVSEKPKKVASLPRQAQAKPKTAKVESKPAKVKRKITVKAVSKTPVKRKREKRKTERKEREEVKRDLPDPYTAFEQGVAFYNAGLYEQAIRMFQIALTGIGENEIILNNIGASWMKLGDEKKAREYFKRAIRVNPRYTKPYLNLALLELKKGKILEALRNIRTAVVLDPSDPETKVILGLILEQMGDVEGAKNELAEAEKRKRDAIVFYNLARIYETLGDKDKAKMYYRKSLAYGAGIPELEGLFDKIRQKLRQL